MTLRKELGTKFEIWLELLLKSKGYQNVYRNIQYHKSQYEFRQVDLQYSIVKNKTIYNVGIEAKYSSNGKIPFNFRHSKKMKRGQLRKIENIVDEVIERKLFTGLSAFVLVTNSEFDKNIIKSAKYYNIILIDKYSLKDICKEFSESFNIEESINSINITNYNLSPNRLYLY